MSKKYHVNDAGNPGQCSAKIQCPFGGDESHYGSEAEARTAFENSQKSQVSLSGKASSADKLARTAGANMTRDELISYASSIASHNISPIVGRWRLAARNEDAEAMDKLMDSFHTKYSPEVIRSVLEKFENPTKEDEDCLRESLREMIIPVFDRYKNNFEAPINVPAIFKAWGADVALLDDALKRETTEKAAAAKIHEEKVKESSNISQLSKASTTNENSSESDEYVITEEIVQLVSHIDKNPDKKLNAKELKMYAISYANHNFEHSIGILRLASYHKDEEKWNEARESLETHFAVEAAKTVSKRFGGDFDTNVEILRNKFLERINPIVEHYHKDAKNKVSMASAVRGWADDVCEHFKNDVAK